MQSLAEINAANNKAVVGAYTRALNLGLVDEAKAIELANPDLADAFTRVRAKHLKAQ